MTTKKTVASTGIILCFLYFFVVVFFIATGSQTWLIAFEIVTMISGIYFIFLISVLPFGTDKNKKIYKTAAVVFVAALTVLTNLSHAVSLTVIKLLQNGITVPEYFQIGKTPSVITAVEYLGWGIFMGLAFLFSSFGIEKDKKLKPLKITLSICAALCLFGFFGWLVNENLWYIAPVGYGLGTVVICAQILLYERKLKQIAKEAAEHNFP